ncbi:hypothetical protein ACLMJK_009020 [Lecanora helva]
MSQSPATPDKSGQRDNGSSPKLVAPLLEKPSATSNVQQASLHEPSPASTYGGTAGSSVPVTPEDATQIVLSQDMMNMLKITSADPAIESIYGSPARGRERGSSAKPDRFAERVVLVSYTSPSNKQKLGGIVLPRNTSTSTSPSSDRLKLIRESPTWRLVKEDREAFDRDAGCPSNDFVKRTGNEADDVFGSPRADNQSPRQDEASRPFQTNGPISNDNAQALLPPSACVFVANLTQSQTDDQLEHHVQNAFSQFGTCYVKIRRDNNGMPFAFVQYETVEDAQRAITQGRGMHINNRPCRTEVAKVNRSLYLSRVTGGPISETEARKILSNYGDIEKVWYSSQTESEIFRLPEGIWVMFKLFQPSRDAQAAFRDHAHYRLEQPPMADDFRSRIRNPQYQSVSPLRPRQSPGRIYPSPMRRAITTDLRSIFVGNLPANINEEQLFHMFDAYGAIQHIEIVRKPSANFTGVNAFAFIEYVVPEGALAAVQASPRMFGNARLRVEPKESTDPSARLTLVRSGGSPRSYFGESQDQMAMLYQRGLYAGLAQAAQTQAMPPPVWTGFPYYQPYDPNQYGQYTGVATVPNDNTGTAGLQAHSSGYTTQAMAQVQYPQPPSQYVPCPVQPPRASYQWPPVGSGAENVHISQNLDTQENQQL